jgi:hypothetical protein
MAEGMMVDVRGTWWIAELDRQILGRQVIAAVEEMLRDDRPTAGALGSSVLCLERVHITTIAQMCRDGVRVTQSVIGLQPAGDSQPAPVVESSEEDEP